MKYIKKIIIYAFLVYVIIIAGLYTIQDKLLFHPHKLELDHKERNLQHLFKDFRYDEYNEIFLNHPNGTVINAQLIPTNFQRKGLVYYLHGNRGNISSQKIDIPEFLDRGYDVFMIDYQGYGKSEGKPSKKGLENDVLLGFDYLQEKYKQDSIIIVGHSMGSYAATYCATKRNSKLLILMTPIYKLKEVLTCKFPFLILPFPLKNNLDNSKLIDKVLCETEVFIAEHDHLIPFKSTSKFKIHANNRIKVNISPNSGHNNMIGSKLVQEMLNELLGTKLNESR